jgi:catechol 2,3-dioxygenase-like lactoylglutathione lyase family enzyme
MTESALLHLAVTVQDLDASVRFYTEVLGFIAAPATVEGGGPEHPSDNVLNGLAAFGENPRYVVRLLRKGTFFLELVQMETGEQGPRRIPMKHFAFDHLAFRVNNVDETLQLAEQFGGTILHQRRALWSSAPDASITVAFCADPSGNQIELVGPTSQEMVDVMSESLHSNELGWGAQPPSIG